METISSAVIEGRSVATVGNEDKRDRQSPSERRRQQRFAPNFVDCLALLLYASELHSACEAEDLSKDCS